MSGKSNCANGIAKSLSSASGSADSRFRIGAMTSEPDQTGLGDFLRDRHAGFGSGALGPLVGCDRQVLRAENRAAKQDSRQKECADKAFTHELIFASHALAPPCPLVAGDKNTGAEIPSAPGGGRQNRSSASRESLLTLHLSVYGSGARGLADPTARNPPPRQLPGWCFPALDLPRCRH
jgi:hypothetical protein